MKRKRIWFRLHSFTQWIYFIFALLIGMLLFHPLLIPVGILLLTGIHWFSFGQFRLSRWIRSTIFIILLFTIINPLFNHRGNHILFTLGQPITLEAVLYGCTFGLSMVMILLVFRLYQDLFSSAQFLTLFHRFSPQWSILLMLSLRFVPLFQRRLSEIKTSQEFRWALSSYTWKQKIIRSQEQLLTLLSWSMEDALQTVDSMKARNYGTQKRTSYQGSSIRKKDIWLCGWMTLLFMIHLVLWFLGYGRLDIYPLLESVSLSLGDSWVIFIDVLLLATPIWYEGGEQIRWHIWKSRMSHLPTQKPKKLL